MAAEQGGPSGATTSIEDASPAQLIAELRSPLNSKEADLRVKRLIKLSAARCPEEAPEAMACIIFQSNHSSGGEPGRDWRSLSNFAHREFAVDIATDHLSLRGSFSSVEGLFQGLKFNLTEQFACGGLLVGAKAGSILEPLKAGITAKLEEKLAASPENMEGFVALQSCRLLLRAAPGATGVPELATLQRRRGSTLAQADAGLTLLACQLFMYAQSAAARELLAATADLHLEEFNDGEHGPDFYSRVRPSDGNAPTGANANGQNLMHVRRLLSTDGGAVRAMAHGRALIAQLSKSLVGGEVLSKYGTLFYADAAMTYAQLLELAAPCADGAADGAAAPQIT